MTAPEQFDWRKWAQRYCDGSSCGTDIPTCGEALLRRALEAVAEMVPLERIESVTPSTSYTVRMEIAHDTPEQRDARISAAVLQAIGGGK